MKRNIVNKTLTSTDDAPKVANNVEKLPKRYWFTLILMWIVCSFVFYLLFYSSQIPYYIRFFRYSGGILLPIVAYFFIYIHAIPYFCIFLLFFLIMIYLVTHYLEKINLIRIYSAAFYLTLFLFIYTIYTHIPNTPFPKVKTYKYMMRVGEIVFGFYMFIFSFLTLYTSYFVLQKKLQNILSPVAPITNFLIFWSLMFIIYFPVIAAYVINYIYH